MQNKILRSNSALSVSGSYVGHVTTNFIFASVPAVSPGGLINNCVFSHGVMAAIFVSQNNETAAMFVSQTSPVGVELFSYVNAFFCSNKFA